MSVSMYQYTTRMDNYRYTLLVVIIIIYDDTGLLVSRRYRCTGALWSYAVLVINPSSNRGAGGKQPQFYKFSDPSVYIGVVSARSQAG
eukprot:SAG31_NODE_12146_length_964_cov_1.396532_1_plen_87_part_01